PEPLAVEYVTDAGPLAFPDRVTVKVAVLVAELPSLIETSLIEKYAAASSLTMVATPVSSDSTAQTGDDSRNWNVLSGSGTVSPLIVTGTVWVFWPTAKLTVVVGTAT